MALVGVLLFTGLFIYGLVTVSAISIICGIVFGSFCGYFVFRDTLGIVQGVGPVYWLVKPLRYPHTHIGVSHMAETDYPWRVGVGLNLMVYTRSFHVGVCRRRRFHTEDEGILTSVGGRYMDADIDEIGEWK